MQSQALAQRADSLSSLQNLGRPLGRVQLPASPFSGENPLPGMLDFSLDARNTRLRKCCKEPPHIERMSSEFYPIDASYLKDLRPVREGVFGRVSRFDGRDPIAYLR